MAANRIRRAMIVIITGLLTIVTLAGCASFNGDMTLYQGGQWKGFFDLIIPRETLTLAGGEEAFDAQMEAQLGAAGVENVEDGATYSYKKIRSEGGAVTYRISMSGKDVESLSSVLEGGGNAWIETDPDGEELIHFAFNPTQALGDDMGMLSKCTFSLRGGEILANNADSVEGNTAKWNDLSGRRTAEAIVIGARQWPVGVILLLALGIVAVLLAVGAAVLALRRRRAAFSSPRFCTSCGERLAAGAGFCTNCGSPVTTTEVYGGQ